MSEVKNIHVCLVTISLGTGGAQRVVAAHTQMFATLGYKVTTAVLRDPIDYAYAGELLHLGGKNPDPEARVSAEVPGDKIDRQATNPWQRLWRLYRFIKDNKPDVIIDHRARTNILKEWVYQKFIYRNTRVIYVSHSAHTPIYMTNSPGLFGRLTSKAEHVGVSRYITEDLMPRYGLFNRNYIPNFVAPKWLDANPGVAQTKSPYFLWYGRLDDSVKDISFLMESFAMSQSMDQGFTLVIMGSGPDGQKLQQKAEALKIKSSVTFLPFDPSPQALIKGAKCVCLTSHYEGFPMALLEALSLGTPVISLDILSGPNELIKDGVNGLLVGERNSRIFAQAIDNLCLDQAFYQKLKANARLSVEAYGAPAVYRQWKDLIDHE